MSGAGTDAGAGPAADVSGATRHLGLDLGGTNLKWTVVERRGTAWSVVARDQVATRRAAAPADIPASVTAQLAEVAVRARDSAGPFASVGVGVPGLYDPRTGRTRFLVNIPGPWAGHPVAEPISAATGVPVVLINDARAFGLAELRLGAGRGASSMVGLTLGTGIGGVVAIDGRVHQGHDGTAGELGHQTIEPDGPWCGCGNRGCLEAFTRADQIAAACGTETAEEAVRAAADGDERARRGLAEVGRYLGIGIANMITVLSPDTVVLGGGVAAAGEILFGPIRDEVARRVRTTAVDEVAIVPAELGTWAGAIGAAIHGAEQAAEARA
ncbi:MAG TPA: ROK family protein [Candidatus Limnocylindrales bacterium]|nr:ROK family protein [Candidatus Limnocylindrales bacterium]